MTLLRFATTSDIPSDVLDEPQKVYVEEHGGIIWETSDGGLRALWGPMSYDEANDHVFLVDLGIAPDLPPAVAPESEDPERPREGPERVQRDPERLQIDEALRSQVLVELSEVVGTVAAFLGPIVGLDLYHRTEDIVDGLCAQLMSSDPDDVEEACGVIRKAIWSRTEPSLGWWRTPLGRACAPTLGFDGQELTALEAGELLGLKRSRIYQLLKSGELLPGPRGVNRASAMRRLLKSKAKGHRRG